MKKLLILIYLSNSFILFSQEKIFSYDDPYSFTVKLFESPEYFDGVDYVSKSCWAHIYYKKHYIFTIENDNQELSYFRRLVLKMKENKNLILYRLQPKKDTWYNFNRLKNEFDLKAKGKKPFRTYITLKPEQNTFRLKEKCVYHHSLIELTDSRSESWPYLKKFRLILCGTSYKISQSFYNYLQDLKSEAQAGDFFVGFNINEITRFKKWANRKHVKIMSHIIVERNMDNN